MLSQHLRKSEDSLSLSQHMSFLAPTGLSEHSCGYCHSDSDTSIAHGAWAYALTPLAYQHLIDHGWRRSGQYLYKPAPTTCCPAYTIRLDTTKYQLTKGQKKTLKKLKKYILEGLGKIGGGSTEGVDKDLEKMDVDPSSIDETMAKSHAQAHSKTTGRVKPSEKDSKTTTTTTHRADILDSVSDLTRLLREAEGLSTDNTKHSFRVCLMSHWK
jgi:arginine-tRNA-protein transferase